LQNTYKFNKGDRVQIFRFIQPANFNQLMQSKLDPQAIFKQFTKDDTGEQGTVLKRRKKLFGAAIAGNQYYVIYDDGSEEWHSEKEIELIN